MKILPALLAVALLVPVSAAEQPSEAPQAWQELFGDDALTTLRFTPDPSPAGGQFEAVLAFEAGSNVTDVRYQICRIGNSCFAIGVEAHQNGDQWTADTRDVKTYLGFDEDPEFKAGDRIGLQFFVCRHEECHDEIFNETADNAWVFFPHGDECDINLPGDEWVACQETHYFGVDITAAEKAAPSVGLLVAGLLLTAGALMARRRS